MLTDAPGTYTTSKASLASTSGCSQSVPKREITYRAALDLPKRLSLLHARAVMSGATRFQGVEKGSTAYKLLAKMGWEEGKGLVRGYSRLKAIVVP